jgi:proteasome alpha subunit
LTGTTLVDLLPDRNTTDTDGADGAAGVDGPNGTDS